ncbi:unnamed protein product [Eruca vesicaria subsp. sativa]|uniref:NAC domain-containing protein n=1 Tax=Eruca vesicaria subsp. sativa TaxID=29727 RepID=A0ABC8JTN4_ERUVS|nr:unnamed protein product [Eruca vesicaria subsp. sativa]
MERNLVGYRFSPTKEELINYYLKNKILGQLFVDDAISEINFCDYDPKSLPLLSKLKTNDLEWYFFSIREYYAPDKTKKGTKRTTPNGFWKVTGKPQEIKDKRGYGEEAIGIKKTLVYHQGRSANGVKTPWVMDEYHITSWPFNQSNYVICKVKYKGVDGDSLFGNKSYELNHSTIVSVPNTAREMNTTPEVEQPREDHLGMSVDDLENLLNEQDDPSLFNTDTFLNNNYYPYQQPQAPCEDDYVPSYLDIIMTQHRNDHMPKKPLTGTLTDNSSDSDDAESIFATSYQGISSPDSVHNSSRHFHPIVDEIPALRKDSCKDTQPHAETSINRKTRTSHFTRRMVPSKQEVKECKSKAVDASMDKKSSSSMVKTEKKGWFNTEEAMDKTNFKNTQYIYLMNMIIVFIFLVAVVGNIMSGLLSVKT